MLLNEEYLSRIDNAYKRLVISSGAFETDEFTKCLNESDNEKFREQIGEFLRHYQGDNLFIQYESLLKYFNAKQGLAFVLNNMADAQKDYFLYIFTPENETDIVTDMLGSVLDYEKKWLFEIWGADQDDGYVIKIDDHRFFNRNNYIKIYPNGNAVIVTDYDYQIEKINFSLSQELIEELNEEVKKKVFEIIEDTSIFFCDDRSFFKSFIVTYGFEWVGQKHSWGKDYQDYFLNKYPMRIIEKIMQTHIVQEKFVYAKVPNNVKERINDDI